jgi:hypothetical protein
MLSRFGIYPKAQPMLSKLANAKSRTTFGAALGWIAAWVWTVVAGGGGLWLLWTKGPWPLTNGWFALFSGIAACPVTGWLFEKYADVKVSGYVRLAAASFFWLAGRIALAVGI